MDKKLRLVLFLLLSLPTINVFGNATIAKPFRATATICWFWDDLNVSISDSLIHGMLSHIKSVGYSGVTFDYFVDVGDDGTVINSKPNLRMLKQIDYARSIGLTVDTKIHWTTAASGGVDNLNSWTTSPAFDANKFFYGVEKYFSEFSKVAQQHGISMQYLGTESDNLVTQAYRDRWKNIISIIRSGFSGKIAYDGNYFGTKKSPFNDIAIWDLVDNIALSFYPRISQFTISDLSALESLFITANPALANPLGQDWNDPVDSITNDISALSARYGKQVILGELYYQPIAKNLSGPVPTEALVKGGVPIDRNAQTLVYKALFNVINQKLSGTVVGVAIWGYWPWLHSSWSGEYSYYNYFKDYDELSNTTTENAISEYLMAYRSGLAPIYPAPTANLSVKISKGNGSIVSIPEGINCGSTCNYSFTKGMTVKLMAAPGNGAKFGGWSGGCVGRRLTCSVKIKTNKSVKAKFN